MAGLTTVALEDHAVQRQTFLDVIYGELSPGGTFLLLARRDGSLQVLETASGVVKHHLDAAAINPRKLYYLPEAGLLFVADGTELTVWDLAAGAADAILEHARPLVDFSRSSDDGRS